MADGGSTHRMRAGTCHCCLPHVTRTQVTRAPVCGRSQGGTVLPAGTAFTTTTMRIPTKSTTLVVGVSTLICISSRTLPALVNNSEFIQL